MRHDRGRHPIGDKDGMAAVGSITTYNPGDKLATVYMLSDQILSANKQCGVGREEACRVLTVVGPATFRKLRSLIVPVAPAKNLFEELVEVLTKHYSPTPSKIVQQFRQTRGDGGCIRVGAAVAIGILQLLRERWRRSIFCQYLRKR